MGDQKPQMADSIQTVADAYEFLGIRDTSIPDEDVAVAFYATYSAPRPGFFGPDRNLFTKILDLIAASRQSQWLAFFREMIFHLTKENVSILATKKTAPVQSIESSSTTANIETPSEKPKFQFHRPSPEPFIFGAAANSKPLSQESAAIVDTSDSDKSIASDEPDDASNFSSDFSSNASSSHDDESNTSDTSEPVGGKFWNGEVWCCKVCNEELDDEGKCYDDHTTNPCRYCGKDFEPAACSRYCIECHSELPTPCSICTKHEGFEGEEEASEAMQMVWDERDDVWRCTTCMWEVEANGENEGQCHCTVDPDVSSPSRFPLPSN